MSPCTAPSQPPRTALWRAPWRTPWHGAAAAAAATALGLLAACAQPPTEAARAAPAAADTRRSGFADMSPATQALQRDDAQNPGWLWLKAGEQRFAADCARCHTLASLRDVATRYPAWDERLGKPLALAGRINQCQLRHVQQPVLPPESDALLGLQTVLGHAARGLPIQAPADPRLAPWLARGQQLYEQRLGQLDLSCAQCHDQHAGGRLAGSTIPQGHPTGYPIYRLEWQGMGSLQRRLRNCLTGVRAEPFAPDGDEAVALELWLMQRAAGMPIETPGVRP